MVFHAIEEELYETMVKRGGEDEAVESEMALALVLEAPAGKRRLSADGTGGRSEKRNRVGATPAQPRAARAAGKTFSWRYGIKEE